MIKIDINRIFRLLIISFVLIQPSKILAALTNIKFIQGQFLFPFALYFLFVSIKKAFHPMLRLHLILLAGQLSIAILHILFLDIFFNNYLIFFFVTPHFCLLFSELVKTENNVRFLARCLSAYISISMILSYISYTQSGMDFGLQTFFATLGDNFIVRSDTEERNRILIAINYGYILLGLPRLVLEGVALAVYPLVFLSLCFIRPQLLRDKFLIPGILASFCYILAKSSRGEILYLVLLVGFPIAKLLFEKVRWPALLILFFGFVQLALESKTLNGRTVLNDLFISSISIMGKGIGYSAEKILELTKNDYSSFHNIHFELITNFGLLLYGLFILFTATYVLKRDYSRAKHFYLCLLFVLFSTNFELFDIYFAVPLGFVTCEILWLFSKQAEEVSTCPLSSPT